MKQKPVSYGNADEVATHTLKNKFYEALQVLRNPLWQADTFWNK